MAYDMVSPSLIHAIEHDYRNDKFTDDDVSNHMDWAHDAERWAEAQLVAGTATDFVKSLMQARARWGSLTKGQYRGLMNMIRAEVLSADRAADQLIEQLTTGKEPLDLSKLPTGHYAINTEDSVAFYHIDNVIDGKWKGWVFANLKVSDNKRRLGIQRPGQKYQGQHEENLRQILTDPLAAAMRYGQLIGSCGICGRALTSEWRTIGIGPVCYAKLHGHRTSVASSIINRLKSALNLNAEGEVLSRMSTDEAD